MAAPAKHRLGERAEDVIASRTATLPPPDDPAFAEAFDQLAQARVVLLGEATHGTAEFYRARAGITRRLIQEHGFRIVAVEADWPDALRIDRYVRGRSSGAVSEPVFTRFPTWMWRNIEVADFIDWLQEHNATRPEAERTSFHGLDLYGLSGGIAEVLAYLDRVDPDEAKRARERYGCMTPWQREPAHYGHAVVTERHAGCQAEVTKQLMTLLERRLAYSAQDGEEFFDAVQNARLIRAAESYYRIMYEGSTESWNLRDRHMFETLRTLMEQRGAKAVVWAHNSHIGDAAATEMGWGGQFNIGELCRTAYGRDAVLIGFGTDRGRVAAASEWGGPMEFKQIRPALARSWEAAFRDHAPARSLCSWREAGDVREALSDTRLERAIGVIYRPETERGSHYFEAVLAEQFDAFVWFADTSPVTPLSGPHREGVPETYPFGE